MDLYMFTLVLGAAGLVLMGVSGLAHTGHHTAAREGAHAGHHLGPKASGGRAAPGTARSTASRLGWSLLSPRVLFSLLLGFGATGTLLHSVLTGALLLTASVLGAIAFERLIMLPLWRFFFRFESVPAAMLESCVGDEARAATNFDADGNGLVVVELDGQVVQLLARLCREDRSVGAPVHAGDTVFIDDIDAARNRCTVRLLPA